MPSLKNIKFETIYTTKRVDLSTDHLVKVTSAIKTLYVPIRLSKTHATSFYMCDKDQKEKFITIERKRTINANVKLLIKSNEKILSNSSYCFYTLNKDDKEQRNRNLLAKRKWKVHQLARWTNGFFVARLSCTRSSDSICENTQFILYPAPFQEKRINRTLNYYAQHGAYKSQLKLNQRTVSNALVYESEWPSLSLALSTVEYGYNTEKEAKAGFNYILQKQEYPPSSNIKSKSRNTIKQISVNKYIQVNIVDTYQNEHEKAWLINSLNNYFIMKMDRNIPNKVSLVDRAISTSYTNTIEAAQQMLSALFKDKYTSGWTREESTLKWRDMIKRDLYFRCFTENIRATWLITKIAMKNGNAVGLLAECYPESKLSVPVQFVPLTHRIIFIEDNILLDPSRSIEGALHWKSDVKKFQKLCQELIELREEQFSYKYMAAHKALENILVYTHGFSSNEQALHYFNKTSPDKHYELEGSACPITAGMREVRYDYLMQLHRENICRRIYDKEANEKVLIEFDERLSKSKFYPKQLLDYAIHINLLTPEMADGIKVCDNKYRDDNNVDLFNEINHHIVALNNRISNSEEISPAKEVGITSTKKSNAGRKRIYSSEQEKKKEWARKKRLEIKEKELAAGMTPKVRGRKKMYANPAEKEKSYRLRKKWALLNEEGTLLILMPGKTTLINDEVIDRLSQIAPIFCSNIFFVFPYEYSPTYKDNFRQIICSTKANKVYYKKKGKIDTELLSKILINNRKIFIGGFNIELYGHALAIAIQKLTIDFTFYKSIVNCQDIESVEKEYRMTFDKNVFKR